MKGSIMIKTAPIRLPLLKALFLILCWQGFNPPIRAQVVQVAFELRDPLLYESGSKKTVEAEVSLELAKVLEEAFQFWSFKSGDRPTEGPRITFWPQRGVTCQWELVMQLDTGPPLLLTRTWNDELFYWQYMEENFGGGNPHGNQWKTHVGRRFSEILLKRWNNSIRDALRLIPIGNDMKLGKRGSDELGEFISAVLTPLKPAAAKLGQAQFKLLYIAGQKGNLHLSAKSKGLPPGSTLNFGSINARVNEVVEPPHLSLSEVDRLRMTLQPIGFLLWKQSILDEDTLAK